MSTSKNQTFDTTLIERLDSGATKILGALFPVAATFGFMFAIANNVRLPEAVKATSEITDWNLNGSVESIDSTLEAQAQALPPLQAHQKIQVRKTAKDYRWQSGTLSPPSFKKKPLRKLTARR